MREFFKNIAGAAGNIKENFNANRTMANILVPFSREGDTLFFGYFVTPLFLMVLYVIISFVGTPEAPPTANELSPTPVYNTSELRDVANVREAGLREFLRSLEIQCVRDMETREVGNCRITNQ